MSKVLVVLNNTNNDELILKMFIVFDGPSYDKSLTINVYTKQYLVMSVIFLYSVPFTNVFVYLLPPQHAL